MTPTTQLHLTLARSPSTVKIDLFIILEKSVSTPYTLKAVNTVAEIDKPELGFLIHMLEDLKYDTSDGIAIKHDKEEATKKKYGYVGHDNNNADIGGADIWDEQKLLHYRRQRTNFDDGTFDEMALTNRVEQKNYTFFLLKNADQETVALASGDAPPTDKPGQLRIMNIAVARNQQGEGIVKDLLRQLVEEGKKRGLKEMVVPTSRYAIARGNVDLYQHVATELGIKLDVSQEYGQIAAETRRKIASRGVEKLTGAEFNALPEQVELRVDLERLRAIPPETWVSYILKTIQRYTIGESSQSR